MKARKHRLWVRETHCYIWLQWGRADEGAETSAARAEIAAAVKLQWGRADEGAETHSGIGPK